MTEGTISDDTTMKFHYFDEEHIAYICKEETFKVCLLNVKTGKQNPKINNAQLPANNFGVYNEGDEKLAKLKS